MARRQGNTKGPRWLTFEKNVAELLRDLDPRAFVKHNQTQEGELSFTPRQLDIVAVGTIVGQPIKIVAECKCYTTRPLPMGAVDEFIGKLLDIGAERGILASYTVSATVHFLERRERETRAWGSWHSGKSITQIR
jgi:hypothetical protein